MITKIGVRPPVYRTVAGRRIAQVTGDVIIKSEYTVDIDAYGTHAAQAIKEAEKCARHEIVREVYGDVEHVLRRALTEQ